MEGEYVGAAAVDIGRLAPGGVQRRVADDDLGEGDADIEGVAGVVGAGREGDALCPYGGAVVSTAVT